MSKRTIKQQAAKTATAANRILTEELDALQVEGLGRVVRRAGTSIRDQVLAGGWEEQPVDPGEPPVVDPPEIEPEPPTDPPRSEASL